MTMNSFSTGPFERESRLPAHLHKSVRCKSCQLVIASPSPPLEGRDEAISIVREAQLTVTPVIGGHLDGREPHSAQGATSPPTGLAV